VERRYVGAGHEPAEWHLEYMGGCRSKNTAMTTKLTLKRAKGSLPLGDYRGEDYDVLADRVVVGRIFMSLIAPRNAQWFWSIAFGHQRGRTPTHGTAASRDEAMAAFTKSWRRE
jgi:hypothetical protein